MVQCKKSLPQCDISVLKDARPVRSLVVDFANKWAFGKCLKRQAHPKPAKKIFKIKRLCIFP
jgi:hypothetical protein